jgi:DNA adenine methylase
MAEKFRPVLKYPGSKWRIAQEIVNLLPEHRTYVEPFFGSGAVLFNKPKSRIETANDMDLDVVNLFKVIRDHSIELARLVEMTPFARYEYDQVFENALDPCNEIEKARRFLIKCWMGHGFRTNGYKVGWKNDVQGRERSYALWNWTRLPEWVLASVDRLKEVQIENRPALEIIERYNYENVVIYADPPYMLGTRTAKQYKHEMVDDDHIELLEALKKHKGHVLLSGYESDLYNSMLEGWHLIRMDGYAEYVGTHGREECLWMNFRPSVKIGMF